VWGGRVGRAACSVLALPLPRTLPALPLPLLQGERVGVRGLSASHTLVEAPLTPTLSAKVGFTRLWPTIDAEIGQARFRCKSGERERKRSAQCIGARASIEM